VPLALRPMKCERCQRFNHRLIDGWLYDLIQPIIGSGVFELRDRVIGVHITAARSDLRERERERVCVCVYVFEVLLP
jgi:hypothetical protein